MVKACFLAVVGLLSAKGLCQGYFFGLQGPISNGLTKANCVSADGKVVGGHAYDTPFENSIHAYVWRGKLYQGIAAGGAVSYVTALSGDGSVVAGTRVGFPSYDQHGFRRAGSS